MLLAVGLLLTACEKQQTQNTSSTKTSDAEIDAMAEKMVDSVAAAIDSQVRNEDMADTAKLKSSPVRVLKFNLVKREYSNYRDIELKYKNVSDKTIEGIRFEWFGTNAFGEPADMGGTFIEGRGGGFTDETLKPGKTTYSRWEIFSNDAKKIITARPYEVVFSDGSKWTLK